MTQIPALSFTARHVEQRTIRVRPAKGANATLFTFGCVLESCCQSGLLLFRSNSWTAARQLPLRSCSHSALSPGPLRSSTCTASSGLPVSMRSHAYFILACITAATNRLFQASLRTYTLCRGQRRYSRRLSNRVCQTQNGAERRVPQLNHPKRPLLSCHQPHIVCI